MTFRTHGQMSAHVARIDARIKDAHDKRCTTWERWTAPERDQNGRRFVAQWVGCRGCGVRILEN